MSCNSNQSQVAGSTHAMLAHSKNETKTLIKKSNYENQKAIN